MTGSTNNSMTNMINIHTCSTSCVDLVIAGVLVPHVEFFELACNMIGSTSIHVPISVNSVGVSNSTGTLLFSRERGVKPLPAFDDGVADLATELAVWLVVVVDSTITDSSVAAPTAIAAATTTTTTSIPSAALSTRQGVDGGLRATLKEFHAHLKAHHLRIKIAYRYGFHLCDNRLHKRIVVDVEAGKNVRHQLFIIKGLPRRRHLIYESLHLPYVLSNTHVALLCR